MSAPYKPEVIAQQRQIIETLIGRKEGASFAEVGQALGITPGGVSYRMTALVAAGKAWACTETHSSRKRAFATREAMQAWLAEQPPSCSQVVQDLLSIKQPITAAELGAAVGVDAKRASSYMRPMEKRGEVFGCQVGHTMFWYGTEADAKRGRAKAERELQALMAKRTQKAMAGRGRKMKPAIPAGVHVPDKSVAFRDQPAKITSETTVTIIEPPKITHRWQAIPDSGQSIFADRPRYGTGG